MTENLLTIENAILHLDELRHLKEDKPQGFYCSKFTQEGILIVTNLRFSFFYMDTDNEFKFDHALFNLITKVYLEISIEDVYLDITYAYDRQKFRLKYRTDIDKIQNLLEKYLQDKFEVRKIKNIAVENNYSTEITSNTSYNFKPKENNDSEPEVLIIDNASKEKIVKAVKKQSIKYLKITANIIIIFLIASAVSTFFPDVRAKLMKKFIYVTNFVKIQQTEKEVYQIGIALVNYHGEKVYNLPQFINSNFEKKYGKRAIDRDPWGGLYEIDYNGDNFKIISAGPDKKINTYDDIFKEFTKNNKNN